MVCFVSVFIVFYIWRMCTSPHCCHELCTCRCYNFDKVACKFGKVPKINDIYKRIQCPLYCHQHRNKNVCVVGMVQRNKKKKKWQAKRKRPKVSFRCRIHRIFATIIHRHTNHAATPWNAPILAFAFTVHDLYLIFYMHLMPCHFVLQSNGFEFVSFVISFVLCSRN